jgi:hypothetical protein
LRWFCSKQRWYDVLVKNSSVAKLEGSTGEFLLPGIKFRIQSGDMRLNDSMLVRLDEGPLNSYLSRPRGMPISSWMFLAEDLRLRQAFCGAQLKHRRAPNKMHQHRWTSNALDGSAA